MVEQFKPSNRFSDVVSVAAAAVEWQGLTAEQAKLVIVENGLPFLSGVPELTQRAEALLEAAERRAIVGYTHNEDGVPLPTKSMRLYRDSVDIWVGKANRRRPPELPVQSTAPSSAKAPEQLLRAEDAWVRLGISKTTFYRRVREGAIEAAHVETPPRWRSTYIDSLMAPAAVGENEDI